MVLTYNNYGGKFAVQLPTLLVLSLPSEVDIPKEVCDPDSIVSRVKGQIPKDQQPEEFHDNQTPSASNIPSAQRSVPSTQHSLAIEVVRQKKVYHVPEAKTRNKPYLLQHKFR